MKLSLLTHQIASSWDLPTLIDVAKRLGYAGLEFRVEENGGHGVELERTAAERREIRNRIEDAYLEVANIGTGSRLDYADSEQRAKTVDHLKHYVELAADLGCGRIRVFGNDVPDGVDRRDCVAYIGDSLRILGEFAEPVGVDILLEMHGQFNYWGFARGAVEAADHPRVALLYNCDKRDPSARSISAIYNRVRGLVRHIHLHDLTTGYPYQELFGLLIRDNYEGYIAPELPFRNPTAEQYLTLYTTLVKQWAHNASSLAAPDQGV